MLEFDPAGNLVGHWGGPGEGYEWPQSNHGITVDHKNNVWIGGNGEKEAHVLKFTREGKLLTQIGRQGKSGGSNDLENFGRVAKIFVDPKSNEAYIADCVNEKVYVIERETLKVLTNFGDGGRQPGQFFGVHSIATDSKT